MTPGVITGGWGFVWAVYALSFAMYTIYAVWVVFRWKSAERQARRSR